MASIWDDPKVIERVKEAWLDEGLSASQIGAELGVSRNAAIGKITRLGLAGKGMRSQGQQTYPKKRRRRAPSPKPVRINLPPEKRPPPMDVDGLRGTGLPALHVLLENLEHGMCRYPYGEKAPFTFCGAPALQKESSMKTTPQYGPYCKAHAAICYREGGTQSYFDNVVERLARTQPRMEMRAVVTA